MGIFDFLFGSKSKMKPFDKGSLNSLQDISQSGGLGNNQLYGAGSNYLQQLLSNSPEAFQHFEAPFMQNFEQNIVPGIAERFAGAGTGAGASSSSALYNSLAQAGKNLQVDLAGLRGGLQSQGLNQALNYAQQPIQNRLGAANSIQNQFYEIPGQNGLIQSLLNALGGGFAGGYGFGKGYGFGGGS